METQWHLLNFSSSLTTNGNELVLINGSTFQMGSQDGGDDEKPIHEVTLDDFYLSKYEVTVAEFSRFIEATGYRTDADKDGGSYMYKDGSWEKTPGINWQHDAEGNKRPAREYDHPVIHVSWNDAVAFCNWRSNQENLQPVYTFSGDQVTATWTANGYRLPTEAEWEYAARGQAGKDKWAGTSTESQLAQFANFCDKSCGFDWAAKDQDDNHPFTAPVGYYKPNDFELHDMSGNVWEWCWDWYGDYPSSAQLNPSGISKGSLRVYRGGSWRDKPAYLRCANRGYYSPGRRGYFIGFRLSRAATR